MSIGTLAADLQKKDYLSVLLTAEELWKAITETESSEFFLPN